MLPINIPEFFRFNIEKIASIWIEKIRHSPRPYMIVASNGMLTGGRVLHHLRDLIDDPNATLLFVGYQGQGTLGAHLQSGAKQEKLDGQMRDVRCQVRSISGFSAHADESELLEWARAFTVGKRMGDPRFPRKVFVVHGDPPAVRQEALGGEIDAADRAGGIVVQADAVRRVNPCGVARRIALGLEYAPSPPYPGSPRSAAPGLVTAMAEMGRAMKEERRRLCQAAVERRRA